MNFLEEYTEQPERMMFIRIKSKSEIHTRLNMEFKQVRGWEGLAILSIGRKHK